MRNFFARIKAMSESISGYKLDVISNNECFVVTSQHCRDSDKVAAYDLDGTLIKTVTGGPFPKDIYDWQLNLPEVPAKLKSLHESGFKIVIFTNQAFVQFGTFTIGQIMEKFVAIQKKINIPMQFFAAGAFNIYRKPRVAMWSLLQNSFNGGTQIDKSASFFVGDAAGRIDPKTKRRLDHSCADRLFALNLGLKFFTPEQHFLGDTGSAPFTLPGFNPKTSFADEKLLKPESTKLKLDEPELVVLVGYPGAGKSFFASRYLLPLGFEVVDSSDKFGEIKSALVSGKSCVVDDRNANAETRKFLAKLAKELHVKARCFHVATGYHQSMHNCEFRELNANSWQPCSANEFSRFENWFTEPRPAEGFDELVTVSCIPVFDEGEASELRALYESYLLEK